MSELSNINTNAMTKEIIKSDGNESISGPNVKRIGDRFEIHVRGICLVISMDWKRIITEMDIFEMMKVDQRRG